MATAKSDTDEIAKYVKFFAYKAAQIIIHSRSGERTKTVSKANAVGVDWFNIALPGNNISNDIQKEIKSEFVNKRAVIDEPLWIYVYLKTSEGLDSLLEIWNISFTEKVDHTVRNAFTVYNKLALLLKSVIAVSRSLPAYRLTRRKERDFSFSYKICSSELEFVNASRMPTATRVGCVGTQYGSIVFTVQFQTKIDFFTNNDGRLVASFADPKPKVLIEMNKDEALESLKPLDPAVVEELRKAALDDITESSTSLPSSFRTMSPQCIDDVNNKLGSLYLHDISQPLTVGHIDDDTHRALAAFGEVTMENSKFELPEVPSTPPLMSSIQSKINESLTDQSSRSKKLKNDVNRGDRKNSKEAGSLVTDSGSDGLDGTDSGSEATAHAVGFEDDFVLVEVRPAFAPQTGDAGQLYRECKNPPKLEMFNTGSDFDSENDESITDHLERYENQLAQFDEFFKNLEHMTVS